MLPKLTNAELHEIHSDEFRLLPSCNTWGIWSITIVSLTLSITKQNTKKSRWLQVLVIWEWHHWWWKSCSAHMTYLEQHERILPVMILSALMALKTVMTLIGTQLYHLIRTSSVLVLWFIFITHCARHKHNHYIS